MSSALTVKEARDKFILEEESRHLRDSSLYKYRLLFRQLRVFADERNLQHLNELGLES